MANFQDMFDRGVANVKGAVSGVAVESQGFMRAFVRMCSDGYQQGWHERNGGNLSYRLTDDEVTACKNFFYDTPSSWVALDVQAENLSGAHLALTGSGCYLRNVELEPAVNVGIVEVNEKGDAWRLVWGFAGGARPTSELASHILNMSVRMEATDNVCRVIYHAHPINIIALSKILPPDARSFTRVLWKAMTECVMVFPQGVGVLDCMVPGGDEIARASSELMKQYEAVVWAQHGLFVSGADFDSTFGLMHAIEKAATIHGQALAMNGGSPDFTQTISDTQLREIAESLGLRINAEFLDVGLLE